MRIAITSAESQEIRTLFCRGFKVLFGFIRPSFIYGGAFLCGAPFAHVWSSVALCAIIPFFHTHEYSSNPTVTFTFFMYMMGRSDLAISTLYCSLKPLLCGCRATSDDLQFEQQMSRLLTRSLFQIITCPFGNLRPFASKLWNYTLPAEFCSWEFFFSENFNLSHIVVILRYPSPLPPPGQLQTKHWKAI